MIKHGYELRCRGDQYAKHLSAYPRHPSYDGAARFGNHRPLENTPYDNFLHFRLHVLDAGEHDLIADDAYLILKYSLFSNRIRLH